MQFLHRRFLPFSLAGERDDLDDLMRRYLGLTPLAGQRWQPPACVEETDANVMVTIELPGIEARDLSISVDGREMRIAGERREPPREESATCHLDQLLHGPFSLRLDLPADVIADKGSADYRLGLVHVTLPKARSSRRTKVPIQVSKP